MGRKFDPRQTMTEKSTWDVARNSTDIALEFALLGYVSIATELFSLTADFNDSCRACWSPGLCFAWEATGLWPDCIPDKDRTPEALAKMENERILWKRDTHKDDAGLETLMKAAQGNTKKVIWGRSSLRPDDYAAALDVALYLGKTEKANEILKTITENFHWMYRDLSKSRLAWKLLKDKVVARELGLDDEKVRAFGAEVLKTFRERLDKGPVRRPYEHMTMRELVQLCNDNTLKNAVWEETDYDPDNPPKTILRDPATPEDLAALEKKLGCELPDEYKEFLSISNGLGSWWNGFFGEPGFRSTDKVDIMDASEEQQAWEDAGVDLLKIPDLPIKMAWPKFNRVIQINDGEPDAEYVWLIEPGLINKARDSLWKGYDEADTVTKTQIMEALRSGYGGKDASDNVSWLVLTWCPNSVELYAFGSFREFLEYMADETAKEDTLDEEDEQGRPLYSHSVFSYGLR
ncbi:hypothetical protein K432DRAFT_418406 [Lepidopterella palustris CBS 459.81]|uniref:Knr4/Smi1-like domain-containing protein n=1 Tax=Lepidopterella palustris CBS 459.81 TaxID=1314670 RepID=A0A8E2JCX0_9PEZI|nr:hypothetical protein K432DRAFT_418406 [Lepidopterella palustris CBS 459.81]